MCVSVQKEHTFWHSGEFGLCHPNVKAGHAIERSKGDPTVSKWVSTHLCGHNTHSGQHRASSSSDAVVGVYRCVVSSLLPRTFRFLRPLKASFWMVLMRFPWKRSSRMLRGRLAGISVSRL